MISGAACLFCCVPFSPAVLPNPGYSCGWSGCVFYQLCWVLGRAGGGQAWGGHGKDKGVLVDFHKDFGLGYHPACYPYAL